MGVTSNYSFPVPVATDLVKDGWDAINDLGVAVDTAMNTALGTKKAGMVLLNTTSFSAVSSQSINDVFSATYNNYRIVCHLTNTSTADGLNFRFRVSGADNSTTNYNLARIESNSGGTTNRYATGQTSFDINSTDDGGVAHGFIIDFQAPFATNRTVGQMITIGQDSAANYSMRTGGYVFSATTSFTGYTLLPGSGTITGSLSTYAYNA
jgi:hypothetical protein